MSDCKTGADHIKSLKDGRTVYIDGKLVEDVTVHPAFRHAVSAAGALYDFQARPENLDLMTFQPNGSNRRVNRGWQMPHNYGEMVQRRKALQAWSALSGGFLGRSPDHLASALVGQRMGIDLFRKHSEERAKAFADYFDYATNADLFLTYVIINPQAERSKAWGEQTEDLVARIVDEDTTGITVRGAKIDLGYFLWKQGKFAEAAEKFRAALDRSPEDPEATALLGRCIKMDGPRPGDSRSEGRERIKTAFEDSAWRQLQAELKKKK